MASEVISQITDYHVYNYTVLTCTAFYTQSIACMAIQHFVMDLFW